MSLAHADLTRLGTFELLSTISEIENEGFVLTFEEPDVTLLWACHTTGVDGSTASLMFADLWEDRLFRLTNISLIYEGSSLKDFKRIQEGYIYKKGYGTPSSIYIPTDPNNLPYYQTTWWFENTTFSISYNPKNDKLVLSLMMGM